MHSYTIQHSTCTSSFINGKYDCRHKLGKNTYLIENLSCNQLRRWNVRPNHRPTCSLISQQRCHPRSRHDSPRNKELIGLHIYIRMKLHQMDVKTTFPNGEIKEEFYIEKPMGFVIHEKDSHVWVLKKGLYWLNQAP